MNESVMCKCILHSLHRNKLVIPAKAGIQFLGHSPLLSQEKQRWFSFSVTITNMVSR